jgi:flagellar protein FlgJ
MNTSVINALAGTAHLASGATAAARMRPAGFNPAALRQAAPAEQRAAVAAQFEAILVRQLLGPTMNSLLGGAESGAAGAVYGDMLADNIAQQLSAGPGLGLGRFLQRQLTPASAAPAASSTTETHPTP